MGAVLSSERQILNLIHRYAELVDATEFDAVGELFADAAYDLGRGSMRGDEVADAMRRAVKLHDGDIRTRHVVSNTIIEFADDGADAPAAARSYFTVFQAVEGLPLQPIVCGTYVDTFSDDGLGSSTSWRFLTRRVVIDLVGNMSEHTVRPRPATAAEP